MGGKKAGGKGKHTGARAAVVTTGRHAVVLEVKRSCERQALKHLGSGRVHLATIVDDAPPSTAETKLANILIDADLDDLDAASTVNDLHAAPAVDYLDAAATDDELDAAATDDDDLDAVAPTNYDVAPAFPISP